MPSRSVSRIRRISRRKTSAKSKTYSESCVAMKKIDEESIVHKAHDVFSYLFSTIRELLSLRGKLYIRNAVAHLEGRKWWKRLGFLNKLTLSPLHSFSAAFTFSPLLSSSSPNLLLPLPHPINLAICLSGSHKPFLSPRMPFRNILKFANSSTRAKLLHRSLTLWRVFPNDDRKLQNVEQTVFSSPPCI